MKEFVRKCKIEVITGCMASGKTEELIRRLRRFQVAGVPFQLFKSSLDTRAYTETVSRNGNKLKAVPVKTTEEIMSQLLPDTCIVAIDEAQFIEGDLLELCQKLTLKNMLIVVACLDMDYTGKPFAGIPELLACADDVAKLRAVCSECGKKANFSHRISGSKEQVLIEDGEPKYVPLCRRCWEKQKTKEEGW